MDLVVITCCIQTHARSNPHFSTKLIPTNSWRSYNISSLNPKRRTYKKSTAALHKGGSSRLKPLRKQLQNSNLSISSSTLLSKQQEAKDPHNNTNSHGWKEEEVSMQEE